MIELLSKNKFSYIKSLQQSKFRQKYRKFTVEGLKSISEFLKFKKFDLECLVTTENDLILVKDTNFQKIFLCKEEQMKSLSNMVTPTEVLGVFEMNDDQKEEILKTKSTILLLDGIQDPGNVGTIIRSADWFGVKNILRTVTTADFYHPKVVQATMGSLNNVNFGTLDNFSLLKDKVLVGMDMHGEPIHNLKTKDHQIFILGSEGQGISKELQSYCHQFFSISGDLGKVAESLNVGVTAGILLFHLSGQS